MRKNKQRTALHTFFILSLIFLVAFVVLNIVYFVAINEMQFGDYFKELFDDIGGLYVYPFNKEAESAYYLVAVYSSLDVNPLVISILALAFSGAIFILMVIGLIRVLAKKRAGYLFYGLALLVLILVGDIVLLYTPAFLSVVKAYSQGNADAMSAALIAILILVFAALAYNGKKLVGL